mmetsp:Transcript_9063/g.19426  ORF Transcript_9063/g.19426 Transcript_9063/m.19426 type:complete len:727 (-) Transcript_9063:1202-3382(-)|eukprot:CAMPEP_0178482512 /NCGR_PEP_ID=MMETSP0696-20121128/6764_1 /TAXON_ID=265572 /ORGANISM="Extubocellulus spinifer, Strain CCMP396" /LENGTH=726 /DNA_ID=CAMNT_0020110015 /DNA_START=207 /DNA_END=2387 /DNA_ORIENTATION=+
MDSPPAANGGANGRPGGEGGPSESAASQSVDTSSGFAASSPAAPLSTLTPAPNMTSIETIPSLDAPYMYQSRRTGTASSAPLTVRQLCRLLCPPSAAARSASVVCPDTPVIGFDLVSGQYSPQGWVVARSVPVLREAGALWYYEMPQSATDLEGGETKGASSSSSGSNRIMGPISARELSKLLNGEDDISKNNNENNKNGGSTSQQAVKVNELTRVYSSDIVAAVAEGSEQQERQQWKSISELPMLRLALEAFEGSNLQWTKSSKNQEQYATKTQVLHNAGMAVTVNGEDQHQQQTFDPSVMTFDVGGEDKAEGKAITDPATSTARTADGSLSQQEADDLEAFLNSTAKAGDVAAPATAASEEEGEEYESDGGTRYVRDSQTGNWIHEALAPAMKAAESKQHLSPTSAATVSSSDRTVRHANKGPSRTGNNKAAPIAGARKRKKKGKFSAKNAKCWVYVTGLPFDANEDEVAAYFGKVGVLDLDPETQHPKVKLYRRRKGDASGPEGSLKGDASVCYARAESVDLALQFLDESYLRADSKEKLRVQRAKFEQHGDKFEDRGRISNAKRKVAKLAALQAVGWDEGENGRITGGRKGLCIIVLKGMFDLVELQKEGDDKVLCALEQEIRKECREWGDVEKITAFSKNPEGVVVVKFGQPTAANTAVSEYHGRMRKGRRIDASFWDGVTDYTVREEEKEKKEENKRLDEFGQWLDDQDLPEELRLKVEG